MIKELSCIKDNTEMRWWMAANTATRSTIHHCYREPLERKKKKFPKYVQHYTYFLHHFLCTVLFFLLQFMQKCTTPYLTGNKEIKKRHKKKYSIHYILLEATLSLSPFLPLMY